MITDEQFERWNRAAVEGTIPDNQNPIFAFSMTGTNLMVAMLSGNLDAIELMKRELRNRFSLIRQQSEVPQVNTKKSKRIFFVIKPDINHSGN